VKTIGRIIRKESKIVKMKDGKDGNVIFGQVEEITSRAVGAKKANLVEVTLFGPDVVHTHERAEETYVCESGRGKIILGDEISDFDPGVKVIIPPGTPHAVKPWKSFPQVVFLCVSSPPFNQDDVHPDPRGRKW